MKLQDKIDSQLEEIGSYEYEGTYSEEQLPEDDEGTNESGEIVITSEETETADWVENNLVFPDGELQGQKVKLFEFQKKPINDIVNPRVRKIVLMSSAQLLKNHSTTKFDVLLPCQ
ncbi:Uncharacterised protein [Citrobacter koseri]|nr:Uncharacterised protein [Citrobacter koseri]